MAKAPARFALLALRLKPDINPTYTDAILLGLGEAETLTEAAPVFAAVRHIASLKLPPNDRWLGWPLRRYAKGNIPNDIVSLVIDRILSAEEFVRGLVVE